MRRMNAYTVYLVQRGATSLFFQMIITLELVYHTAAVGLNPLELASVGVVLESMTLAFEIPTGVVADLYSRRLSVIIGLALMGAGFMVEGVFAVFWAVLLTQIIWGIGFTFVSGATDAWLADEIGEERAALAYLRGTQVQQVAGLVGIGLSVALGSIRLNLPILIGGALFIGLALFLALFMPEAGFTAPPRGQRSSWRAAFTTFREGVGLIRARPILMTMMAISAIQGLFVGGFDRLWAAHILKNFTLPALGSFQPVVWFGIINAVIMLLTIVVVGLARRMDLRRDAHIVRVLMALYASITTAVLVFALADTFVLALIAFLVCQTSRATIRPLFIGWITRHTQSQTRATVISMYWQANALGQIGSAPVIGIIGTAFSLRAALSTAALILTPAVALLAHGSRQVRVMPESPTATIIESPSEDLS